MEELLAELERTLPAAFDRRTACKALGGLLSPKSLANLDSLGQGPSGRVKLGKRAGYTKVSFLGWVRDNVVIEYANHTTPKLSGSTNKNTLNQTMSDVTRQREEFHA